MSKLWKAFISKLGKLKKGKDKKKENRHSTYFAAPKDLIKEEEKKKEDVSDVSLLGKKPKGVKMSQQQYEDIVDSDWCYQKNIGGEFLGPFEWDEFKKLYKQGKVNYNSLIMGNDMHDFKKLATCPKVHELLKCKEIKK